MIEKLKYLFAGVLAVSLCGVFVACDNEDDTVTDEWTGTYCFIKGESLGNSLLKSYELMESVGLLTEAKPFTYSFTACLNKVAASDVTVSVSYAGSGSVADTLANTVALSATTMTIPAGELVSEPVSVTIDPAFIGVNDQLKKWDPAVFTISIGSLQSDADVKLSTKTNKIVVTLNKTVKAFLNIKKGKPGNSKFMDRSGWSATLGDGVDGAPENLFDGTRSDVACNTVPWDFTIDLGAETHITGVNTAHWAAGYYPSQIEVFTSSDNVVWKSQGVLDIYGTTQDWYFERETTTRYLKYVVLAPNRRNDVTEFNVYVPAE